MAESKINQEIEVVTLADNVTLIRQGRKRSLICNNGIVYNITLSSQDKPLIDVYGNFFRRASDLSACKIGLIRINSSGQVVGYYANTYAVNSLTAAGTTDKFVGTMDWVV